MRLLCNLHCEVSFVPPFAPNFLGSRVVNDGFYSEIPSNLVLKKVSPRIWLPLLTVAWGIITMCLGFVQNFAGFIAVRALLGAAEGGLLPGIVSATKQLPQSLYIDSPRCCIYLPCTPVAKWPSASASSTRAPRSPAPSAGSSRAASQPSTRKAASRAGGGFSSSKVY